MPRMYVEDIATIHESPRATIARLMHELDQAAAREGHRVTGDVTIGEYERGTFDTTTTYRLEADVIPAT